MGCTESYKCNKKNNLDVNFNVSIQAGFVGNYLGKEFLGHAYGFSFVPTPGGDYYDPLNGIVTLYNSSRDMYIIVSAITVGNFSSYVLDTFFGFYNGQIPNLTVSNYFGSANYSACSNQYPVGQILSSTPNTTASSLAGDIQYVYDIAAASNTTTQILDPTDTIIIGPGRSLVVITGLLQNVTIDNFVAVNFKWFEVHQSEMRFMDKMK